MEGYAQSKSSLYGGGLPVMPAETKTTKMIIVHEAARTVGVGAEISAAMVESEAFNYLEAPIVRLSS